MESSEIERKMKELIPQSEVILCWDEKGEVITGFARKLGGWRKLEVLRETDSGSNDDPFNGKKILEGHSAISLLKVSSSPGHYVIVGGNRIWVPFP